MMQSMSLNHTSLDRLHTLIIQHHPYKKYQADEKIGFEFSLQDGFTYDESLAVLKIRLKTLEQDLEKSISFYKTLEDTHKIVLLHLAYAMGVQQLCCMSSMLLSLKNRAFALSAEELLKSPWAEKNKNTALRLGMFLETGRI